MHERKGPALASLAIHAGLLAMLCFISVPEMTRPSPHRTPAAIALIAPLMPSTHPGGGGGGDNSPIPASRGRLPRFAPRQFTPPMAVIHNLHPQLAMEPTLIGAPDVSLPAVNLADLGDPFGALGPRSNGPGSGGGIGDGNSGGVGPAKGPGAGPGPEGYGGFGVHASTGATVSPVLIYKVEPEFSEQARKAKQQGVVILYGEVDTSGFLRNVRVVRGLGLGLDEKAIEAVRRWRFRPGYRDGRPVVAAATIEVNFHLL